MLSAALRLQACRAVARHEPGIIVDTSLSRELAGPEEASVRD